MKFKVNIGLNNNRIKVAQYFLEDKNYIVTDHRVDNGAPEPIVVLSLETDYKLISKVIADFERICSVMNQECIALSSDEVDILVYNPKFAGQRQKFNNFIS
jgi:hypothetical protein